MFKHLAISFIHQGSSFFNINTMRTTVGRSFRCLPLNNYIYYLCKYMCVPLYVLKDLCEKSPGQRLTQSFVMVSLGILRSLIHSTTHSFRSLTLLLYNVCLYVCFSFVCSTVCLFVCLSFCPALCSLNSLHFYRPGAVDSLAHSFISILFSSFSFFLYLWHNVFVLVFSFK